MAKKQPNVAAFLDTVLTREPEAPAVISQQEPARRRRQSSAQQEGQGEKTVLVGANLPPRYARNLAMLHAETGKDKKALLMEALDNFFVAKGGPRLS